jgi:TPP-dependent 2-oxoacid decarboxylase
MNVAEYLLTRMSQAGLKHLFAVPGDYAMGFLDALDAADPPSAIRRVANVNELGSGYAAEATPASRESERLACSTASARSAS